MFPAGLHSCYVVIKILTVAGIALSVALSGKWFILQILWSLSTSTLLVNLRHLGKGDLEYETFAVLLRTDSQGTKIKPKSNLRNLTSQHSKL